jgi:hypothetical protein
MAMVNVCLLTVLFSRAFSPLAYLIKVKTMKKDNQRKTFPSLSDQLEG